MTAGDAEARLKRARIRAWRRGTKEMDLILGPFADTRLAELSAAHQAAFDALLAENDHDLYLWLSGQVPPAERHAAIVLTVTEFIQSRIGTNR